MPEDLQSLCELGQEQLMRMEYLEAERTLAQAEEIAWAQKDFDTLSRLYMPLQEARRQRRQRCGEGVVHLGLIATSPTDRLDGRHVVENFPHGQLLVAGWGSIEPALGVRRLQRDHMLYVETFLAAVYPVGCSRVVVLVPTEDVKLPPPNDQSVDELLGRLPAHTIVIGEHALSKDARQGNTQTFAEVMNFWEQLHRPFLAAADMQVDPIQKIEAYRRTIHVDYACELAHQNASAVARDLARAKRTAARSS
jgi:hypothetical protein